MAFQVDGIPVSYYSGAENPGEQCALCESDWRWHNSFYKISLFKIAQIHYICI